jgi:hypothetical protein
MPRRVDRNQREITDSLRRIGACVTCTHMVGAGFPDLAVGWQNRTYLLEIKSGSAHLTEDEREWHQNWLGQAAVVRTVAEALAAIGAVEETSA